MTGTRRRFIVKGEKKYKKNERQDREERKPDTQQRNVSSS